MELGFEQHEPTTIWTDSASAQLLATTFQLSWKSQHLTMRINAIHQEVVNKVIVIKWIDTEGNTVGVLTKALLVLPFERHTHKLHHGLGNRPIQSNPINFKAKLKKISDICSSSPAICTLELSSVSAYHHIGMRTTISISTITEPCSFDSINVINYKYNLPFITFDTVRTVSPGNPKPTSSSV